MEVELYGNNYPVTTSNFLNNIEKGIYRNISFYKIIYFSQGKVVHSGIYPVGNYNKVDDKILKLSKNFIPLELKLKNEEEPRYNQQIEDPVYIAKLKNLFEKGSLAMVKVRNKNSSSSEFFISTNKLPELDGRYSVFGKVISGLEILNKIDKNDFIYEIKISD